ncbi:MAG: preprotein translocase subunit YajC [Pirellulales bacterium]
MLPDCSTFVLLAEQEGAAPQSPFGPMVLVTIVAIMFLYMFIVQRPAMKREQETRETLLKNLKKNDRIVTSGGIYGVVTNVQLDADEITIRVDETTNTKLKITRSAVGKVLSDSDGKETAKEK